MTHYQELSTQKYYEAAVTQELNEIQLEKDKHAMLAFKQFLFAMVVFLVSLTAVFQMPAWLPTVTAFLRQ